MSEEITDAQISLLCDVGERDPAKLSEAERGDLEQLRASGYVESAPAAAGLKIKLTAKAHAFLGERGVGLNES